jgi:eukaryotic-like serine/threonine-protein kinase
MNVDQDKVKIIFLEAIEKHASVDWDSYLSQACEGNVAMRRQVEVLLDAHKLAGTFLEKGAIDSSPTVELLPAETLGTQIGPYKILEQIGEGGMGIVYMAEQSEPVRRRVALKVIKPGMDSKHIIARFEAERQALAMMDHVNIARVLDAGATAAGSPYFVMELVHGVPITKYCDENHLTPRQRLELFVPVCQAIQHAHQKGIIHRDVKPSNVLITLNDGKPVAKVIDFGVAKATEQKLTERTLFTQYGTMVGTLEYMSPEQAELNALGVDTRSDIYSLGVLLYELLTGSTPLNRDRIKEVALAEIVRLIKDEEPPKPSTRLSESGAALASISANRQMEPTQLTKLMRGELDWIVMKTLEKDRNRRYETANGLAADLRRYLNDEAIEACPPSTRYRLHKFLRRNKGPVVASMGLAALLVLGIIGTSIGMVWALNAQREATLSAKSEFEQRRRAELAYESEVKQRRLARKAVDEMYTQVAQKWLAKEPRMEKIQREFLEKSLQYYQEFAEEQSSDPMVQLETAKAYRRMGSMHVTLGQDSNAMESFKKGIAIAEKLSADFPTLRDYREELADTYYQLGYLQMYSRLNGEPQSTFEKALGIFEVLTREFGLDNTLRRRLAETRHSLGNIQMGIFGGERHPEKAEKNYGQAVELYRAMPIEEAKVAEDQSSLGGTLNDWSLMFLIRGDLAQARPLLDEAITCQQVAIKLDPRNPTYRQFLSNHLVSMADILEGLGDHEKAVASAREALAVQEKLADDFPEVPHYKHAQAEHAYSLGKILANDNQQEAEAIFDQAIAILEKLSDTFEKVPARGKLLSSCYLQRGLLRDASDRFEEAASDYRGAIKLDPKSVVPKYTYGGNLLKQQKYVEAEPVLREVLSIREQTKPDDWPTFQTMSLIGDSLLGQKKYVDAEPLLLAGYEGIKQQEVTIPEDDLDRITEALERIIQLYDAMGQEDKAQQWRNKRGPATDAQTDPGAEPKP